MEPMQPDEREVREVVAAASQRFAKNYSHVVMPNEMLPEFDRALAPVGMTLKVLDDGEDDGVPVFGVMPCSKTMQRVLLGRRADLVRLLTIFIGLAAMTVALMVYTDDAVLVAAASLLVGRYAALSFTADLSVRRARGMLARMREQGY